jgi:hypothetical protein
MKGFEKNTMSDIGIGAVRERLADDIIIAALKRQGVRWPLTCAACGRSDWQLVPEYRVVSSMHSTPAPSNLMALPIITTRCARCGHCLTFDVGVLGLGF